MTLFRINGFFKLMLIFKFHFGFWSKSKMFIFLVNQLSTKVKNKGESKELRGDQKGEREKEREREQDREWERKFFYILINDFEANLNWFTKFEPAKPEARRVRLDCVLKAKAKGRLVYEDLKQVKFSFIAYFCCWPNICDCCPLRL